MCDYEGVYEGYYNGKTACIGSGLLTGTDRISRSGGIGYCRQSPKKKGNDVHESRQNF